MIPVIYLDMDGVCCDFVSAALKVHGSPLKPEDITKWNMEEVMGITLDEFWAPIETAGPPFWRGLKEYPWFEELYRICRCYAKEVVFLSSPDRSPAAAMGKMQWLMDRFGPCFRDYILTPRKDLVSSPFGLLIDDSEKYCQMWAKDGEGGPFVLVPQPWNSRGTCPTFLTELVHTLQLASDAYEEVL
jgi:hypothetical protein